MALHLAQRNYFITRAVENYTWFVVSDTIIDEEEYICPGSSCIVDPNGYIVTSSQILTSNLLFYLIPYSSLNIEKQERRLREDRKFQTILEKLSHRHL